MREFVEVYNNEGAAKRKKAFSILFGVGVVLVVAAIGIVGAWKFFPKEENVPTNGAVGIEPGEGQGQVLPPAASGSIPVANGTKQPGTVVKPPLSGGALQPPTEKEIKQQMDQIDALRAKLKL